MRRAATTSGIDAADFPAEELRKVVKASLEGARIVILDAPARVDTNIG